MTSTATTAPRRLGLAAEATSLPVEEIEAWLLTVTPVLRALGRQRAAAATSEGRRAWRSDQARSAEAALAAIEHAIEEAEAEDRVPDHLAWLHTSVSAVHEQLVDPADLPIAA